jgi:hypothetical protein
MTPRTRALDVPSSSGRAGSLIHSALPSLSHSQPMTMAISRLPTARSTTICGWPGKATAVAVSTIGLTAGAASRNASAAAGVTPRRISDPAIGTEPHSQPGRITPAQLATGTARAGCDGSALDQKLRGTKTAITAESATPNTRNGVACTMTEMKTVAQVLISGPASRPVICS